MSGDVVTLGEAMLRLWVPPGRRLETTAELAVSSAGAEANVAVALARMGRSVAFLSRLPDSPLGRRVVNDLRSHGVDTTHVAMVPGARMGTYYVEANVSPLPTTVVYDRVGSAAAGLTAADVPWEVVEAARLVHVSGITPALSPSCRDVTRELVTRARGAGAAVTVDVNYRAKLWNPAEAAAVLEPLCAAATVVILTREDAATLFGLIGSDREVATAARERFGVDHLVLTCGADGAVLDDDSGVEAVAAVPAEVVDRIGSGDAFAAGVIHGLLDGDVLAGVRIGVAMAALTLGTVGDQFLATPAEVEAVLAGEQTRPDR